MDKIKLIVSVNNYHLDGFVCTKYFKNIDITTLDCLIFHSSSESELDIILALSKVKDVVPKVIYINSHINPLFYCIFTGMDADIYDDDSYLSDLETLNFLIDNYKNTDMTVKQPNSDVETLAKSIAALSNSSVDYLKKLVANNFWLKTLDTAVTNVDTALARASQVNINVYDLIREATKLIDSMEENNQTTLAEIDRLRQVLADMELRDKEEQKQNRTNAPFIYSTYKVQPPVRKVMYVRVFGNCKYLNSFLLAYQDYLKMKERYTCKILFALPKLKIFTQRYSDMPRLAPDSIDIITLGSSDVYVTFDPKKMILDAFFGQKNVDLFIVVDMLYGDELLTGNMVETFSAASGIQDIRRFKLKPERTFFTLVGTKGSLILPYLEGYTNSSVQAKKNLYFTHCSKLYSYLDSIFIRKDR